MTHMARLIKRYGNRKLYDTQASRYVTLDAVAELVRAGEDLRIIDNETGEDLTALTFAQIILEEQKRKTALLDLPILRWIIQQGGAAVHELVTSVDRGREALESMRDRAERRVKQLVEGTERRTDARGDADSTPGRRLLTELLELPQKQLEQLQQRIDSQLRTSLERVTAHPAVQHELQRLEESIKGLEYQLTRLRRRPPGPRPRRAAKRHATKRRVQG